MKKIQSKVNIGASQERIRIRIEADASPEKGAEANYQKFHILQCIVNDPSLILCGLEPFDTLKMYYTGDRWALEAEAVVQCQ